MRFGRATGRALAAALLAAALPAVLILDVLRPAVREPELIRLLAAEGGAEEAPPLFYTSDVLLLGGCLALIAGLAVLAWRGRDQTLLKLALLGWSLGLTLVGFEAALRWLGRPMVYRPGLRMTLHPDPQVLPGTSSPMRFSTNRVGMRAREWDPAARRVLCVGGSTTICFYLDDDKAWPQRLMALLNEGGASPPAWVGNVGKSGLDTYHHLELLRRLPEAAQVDLVIVLAGVNDLAHSVRVPHHSRRRLAASSVFDAGGTLNPTQPYFKQAFSYRALRGLARVAGRSSIDEEDERGRSYAQRRERRRRAAKDYPLPPLDADLRLYQENLAAIAALARASGSRVLFLTQPTIWQDPMPPELEALTWFRTLGGTGRTLSSPDLARGMALFNQAMLDFCREQPAAECLDLAPLIPKDAVHFYDDEHFTEAGSERVARAVADYLRAKPLGGTARAGSN
jgi:lysophospholipase L1-like esterase